MADEAEPISARELIRHLPELLAGDNPLLGGSDTHQFLRQHPQARAAVLLVSGVVTVSEGAHSRLDAIPPALPREFWKPIDQARRLLSHRLMVLLHDAALYHLDLAIREAGAYVVHLNDTALDPPSPERIEATCSALASELGAADWLAPTYSGQALRALTQPSAKTAAAASEQLLRTCSQLAPDNPMVRLHWLLAIDPHATDVAAWQRYARESVGPQSRANGLHGIANALASHSQFREALEVDVEATAFGDAGAIAWNGIQHALGAGVAGRATYFADIFRQDWERWQPERRRELERVAPLAPWPFLAARSPKAYSQICEFLPASIVERMP